MRSHDSLRSRWKVVTTAWLTLFMINSAQADSAVEQQLKQYREQGAGPANPTRGEALWYQSSGDRSCATCHGESPTDQGRHTKTKKTIEPMALTANPERYTDPKKIDKWYLRNCKWTYGRVCTPQEKTDILSWLASQ